MLLQQPGHRHLFLERNQGEIPTLALEKAGHITYTIVVHYHR